MSRSLVVGVAFGLWCVAVPARADVCKSLGVGGAAGTRIAISTEVRPPVGATLLMTLEVVSGVPQLVVKSKSAKAAAENTPALFVFSGGARGSWIYESSSAGMYVFTPLDATQLGLLDSKALERVELPLATGGHEDFLLEKDNQKTLQSGAKCVVSRLET